VEFFDQYGRMLGKRVETFERTFFELGQVSQPTIVETGCVRKESNWTGDGMSTVMFADFVTKYGGKFRSVDISERAVGVARNLVSQMDGDIEISVGDSVGFLENWTEGPIDLLYQDSMDFDGATKAESPAHHMREMEAIYEHLGPRAMVLINDCGFEGGGKGEFVIPWLQERGWVIVEEGRQVLMAR